VGYRRQRTPTLLSPRTSTHSKRVDCEFSFASTQRRGSVYCVGYFFRFNKPGSAQALRAARPFSPPVSFLQTELSDSYRHSTRHRVFTCLCLSMFFTGPDGSVMASFLRYQPQSDFHIRTVFLFAVSLSSNPPNSAGRDPFLKSCIGASLLCGASLTLPLWFDQESILDPAVFIATFFSLRRARLGCLPSTFSPAASIFSRRWFLGFFFFLQRSLSPLGPDRSRCKLLPPQGRSSVPCRPFGRSLLIIPHS